jgi:hypothetical protein
MDNDKIFHHKPNLPSEILDDTLKNIDGIYKQQTFALKVIDKYIESFNRIVSSLKEKSHLPDQPKHLKGCQDFLYSLQELKNDILTLQRTIKKRKKRIERHRERDIKEAIYYSAKAMNKFTKESCAILQRVSNIGRTLSAPTIRNQGDQNGVRTSHSDSSDDIK